MPPPDFQFQPDHLHKTLQSYSYITEEDYNSIQTEFKANEVEILAEYVRDAENMLIEENTYFDNEDTNPYKTYTITGEQLKSAVYCYAMEHLTHAEQDELIALILEGGILQ